MTLTREYSTFFKLLSVNNTTEWFNANKKRYEKDVKEPFIQLVQEVIDLMKKIDPKINVQPKDCLFRINRDIRFSNDKSPYKLLMAAIVSRAGRKEMNVPGIYFHVEADTLVIAGGSYEPRKIHWKKLEKQLQRIQRELTRY